MDGGPAGGGGGMDDGATTSSSSRPSGQGQGIAAKAGCREYPSDGYGAAENLPTTTTTTTTTTSSPTYPIHEQIIVLASSLTFRCPQRPNVGILLVGFSFGGSEGALC